QLGDPYSVFLKPEDFRQLSEATTGNYSGLGIQIDVRDGWITVVAPLPDTPAERAGIQTGDRIVQLDGRSTEGWKQDQAVKELRGPAGTTAELAIRRTGVDKAITYKLTRATIHIRSVDPRITMMLDDRVGYIALSPVSESSTRDVSQAIDTLLKQGMKSLIFDLRGNPGGLLVQRVTRNEAEQEAQVIAAQRGRDTKIDSTAVFHTDVGRTIYGGGGIRPDIYVVADTFTTAERAFIKALGDKIPLYRDALTAYAIELKEGNRLPSPNFMVTQGMVDEMVRRIRAKGADLPDSVVAGARTLIAQEVGYEAARYVFGRSVE